MTLQGNEYIDLLHHIDYIRRDFRSFNNMNDESMGHSIKQISLCSNQKSNRNNFKVRLHIPLFPAIFYS